MNYCFKAILCLLGLLSITLFTDAKIIEGKVLDEDTNPVVGCYVSALELPDSTFISITESNYKGRFSIDLPDKYHKIVIIAGKPGWKNVVVNDTVNPLNIVLERESYTLKEFEVSAKKPLLSYKRGKLIFDPSSIIPNVSTGVELLQQVPFVMTSFENVSIIGHGEAMIYINGKRPNMSHSAVMQYLKNLNPKYVKSVQLVTDKGSGFNSQNSIPIVNIIINDETVGFNGTFSTRGIFTNNAFSPSANLYANYSNEKFTINLQPSFSSDFSNIEKTKHYQFDQVNLNEKQKNTQNYYWGGFEFNTAYKFNSDHELGGYASMVTYKRNNSSVTNGIKIQDDIKETIKDEILSTSKDVKYPNIDAGIYYYFMKDRHKLDITIDARFTKSSDIAKYNLHNVIFDENGNRSNEAVNAALKYQYNTSKGISIKFGGDFLQSCSKRYNEPSIPIEQTYGYGNFTNMAINEDVSSLFIDYSMPLGKMFYIMAGARSEYYNRNASFNKVDYKYNKLFIYPNVSFSFSYPKYNQNLTLKYYILSRPTYYSQLNPTKRWLTSTSYQVGNPYLPNGYSHNFEANYYILDKFLAQFFYVKRENETQTISKNVNGYVVYEDVVGMHSSLYNMALAYSNQFGKYISVRLSNSVDKYEQEVYDGNKFIKASGYSWNFNGMIVVNLSRKCGINMILGGSVNSPRMNTVTSKIGWTNDLWFMISKDFGKFGNVEFVAKNLLYLKDSNYFKSEDYSYTIQDNSNPMFFSLKYIISFGKRKTRNINRNYNSSIESRYL